MKPAIVVSAYNRPEALTRLLASLARANYNQEKSIPLVISIDRAGSSPGVIEVARQFPWQYGPKEVILHPEHLGPIGHFYACGDLAKSFESIIYLEDDLVVSPVFYDYCCQALSFYQVDECVGGFSLYSLWFNGYTQEPFVPLSDESDAFFLQVPYTQGQAFTGDQWSRFTTWRKNETSASFDLKTMHPAWNHFRQDEWFPVLARFLVSTRRYYVFPRISHASGFGDAGTHFAQSTGFFQSPLQREKTSYTFKSLQDSIPVYDSFFEILPDRLNRLTTLLRSYDYTVDLYGGRMRENIQTGYILTSRPCRHFIFSFGKTMWPHEVNVDQAVPGQEIHFARTRDLHWNTFAEALLRKKNFDYFSHGKRLGKRSELKFDLVNAWQMIGRFYLTVVGLVKNQFK